MANYMFEKSLESFGLVGITINVMISEIIRNEDCFQEHLFRHFDSGEHITLTDKTDGQNPKNIEDYWRRTLKTYNPFGLNVESGV